MFENINHDQQVSIERLQLWEARQAASPNNTVDLLRFVCVQQQRQIEMLAGIIAKIAPEEYAKANLDQIQGLPDIDDEEESVDSEYPTKAQDLNNFDSE